MPLRLARSPDHASASAGVASSIEITPASRTRRAEVVAPLTVCDRDLLTPRPRDVRLVARALRERLASKDAERRRTMTKW